MKLLCCLSQTLAGLFLCRRQGAAFFTGFAIFGIYSGLAQVYADSIDGFSGVQRRGGWEYGYQVITPDSIGSFQRLPYFGVPPWAGDEGSVPFWYRGPDYWTAVATTDMHPNGRGGGGVEEVNWAVRRWRSDREGHVVITVSLMDRLTNAGGEEDGVTARISLNGAEFRSIRLGVGASAVVTIPYCIRVNEIVDVAIDPGPNGDERNDLVDAIVRIGGPIVLGPQSQMVRSGETTRIFVSTPNGPTNPSSGSLTYRWQWRTARSEWVDTVNGLNSDPATGRGVFVFSQGDHPGTFFTPEFEAPHDEEMVIAFVRCIVSDTSCIGEVVSEIAILTLCCPADFNEDGFLDFFDYDDYVTCFETGDCPPGRTADFNGDAFVDFFDYDDFVTAFEAGC